MYQSDQQALLNDTLEMVGISPLKTHALAKSSKVKDACERVNRSFQRQKEIVKDIFELPDTSQLNFDKPHVDSDMEGKAKNFDRLMFLLKEKIKDKSVPKREKIQVLTMAPLDWPRKDVASFFEVSEYLV